MIFYVPLELFRPFFFTFYHGTPRTFWKDVCTVGHYRWGVLVVAASDVVADDHTVVDVVDAVVT